MYSSFKQETKPKGKQLLDFTTLFGSSSSSFFKIKTPSPWKYNIISISKRVLLYNALCLKWKPELALFISSVDWRYDNRGNWETKQDFACPDLNREKKRQREVDNHTLHTWWNVGIWWGISPLRNRRRNQLISNDTKGTSTTAEHTDFKPSMVLKMYWSWNLHWLV